MFIVDNYLSVSFLFTVTTQKFVPAAAPDPKSTVIFYDYFIIIVTSKDNNGNRGEGRAGEEEKEDCSFE